MPHPIPPPKSRRRLLAPPMYNNNFKHFQGLTLLFGIVLTTAPAAAQPPETTPTGALSPVAPEPAPTPVAEPPPAIESEITEAPEPPPASDPSPAAPPGLAEQLLGPSVNQHPETRRNAPLPSEDEAIEAEDAAIAAMYRDFYRPANNPGRFNIVARPVYTIAGSIDNTLSGRLGGLTADIGQSFNKFGYAASLTAQFGNILHTRGDDWTTQTIALLGGGLSLSLGRLALLQRGFLDARVGYDFFAAPTRQVLGDPAMLDGVRVPHGPRLQLNMGLMSNPGRARKLFHGFGVTIGYQALVHSLRGEWPVTNMLQFGLVYWGG